MNEAIPDIPPIKKSRQKTVHAFSEARLCQCPGCNEEFYIKRKNQRFCSPECRQEYFMLARQIGEASLEKLARRKKI